MNYRHIKAGICLLILFVFGGLLPAFAGGILTRAIGNSGKVFVIAIGVDEYTAYNMANTQYCISDARKFVERLKRDSSVGDVIPTLLLGDSAKKHFIRQAFLNISRQATAEDIFIFYNATQGVEGCILLGDTNKITSVELYTWSQPILTSRQLFFLDLCHGEKFNQQLKSHILRHPEMSAICKQNRVVLSVSNFAFESESLQGGYFTATYLLNPAARIMDIFSPQARIRTEFIYNLYNKVEEVRSVKDQLNIEYFSEKEFTLQFEPSEVTRGGENYILASENESTFRVIKKGETLCLILGISNYENLSRLKNALPDAAGMHQVLKSKYNAEVIYMEDPAYDEFTLKLVEIQNNYTFEDGSQFLIFAAGHGGRNELGEGCLMLRDCKRVNGILKNYMPLTSVKRFVGQLGCTNSLMLVDICHSGTMFEEESCTKPAAITIPKTNPIYNNKGIAYDNFLNQKTKIFIGSSSDQKAADGQGPHSPFATVVLKFLEENKFPVMDSYYLQENIKNNIMAENAISIPQFCMYGGCKDDGRFMFFLR